MSLFQRIKNFPDAHPRNTRELNEYGQAICGVCRKHFEIEDLEDICEFCNRWFCKDCAANVPRGHGHGKICVLCARSLRKHDRERNKKG